MPAHFQSIATEAAAEILGGDAISFGWPRPEGTAFIPALQNAARLLRLGTPLNSPPLWSKGSEKDAGIDVIAWRDFADNFPGKIVLFGQVASGSNWTEKSVKADTPRFLSWFSERPTQHYIPAIFIPFPQHHGCSGRKESAFDEVARAEAWLREQQYGLVIDRLRIAGAAARRFSESRDTAAAEKLEALVKWASDAIAIARAHS
jgi:hypothetical protein